MQSKISCHSIGSAEFMVLVPYMKKDQQQTQPYNKASTSDSAWSGMMQDLSFLRNIPTEESHVMLCLMAFILQIEMN